MTTPRIIVDEIVDYGLEGKSAQVRRVFAGGSCHLTVEGATMADPTTLEPLHAFAKRIGLRRAWFQPHRSMPHYDLNASRRAAALAAGAVFVPAKEQARLRIEARERKR